MFYYKALIQYVGTGYCGFQWQKDLLTIQGELNRTIHSIVQSKVSTVGASRTDTGVHAFSQNIKITMENSFDPDYLLTHLNLRLPLEIRCLSLSPCSGEFKPSAHHLSKEYRYFFTNHTKLPPDDLKFLANFSRPLDIEKMNQCLKLLGGIHDFSSFCSQGSNVKSTLREVFSVELSEVNPHDVFKQSDLFSFPEHIDRCFQFKICGKGFLKQMVRHLVASLWMVGSGKMTYEEFADLLASPRPSGSNKKWRVAPPQGLFLYDISYPEE